MTPSTRRLAGFVLSLAAWIACGVAHAERAPRAAEPAVALGGEVAGPLRLDAAALAKRSRVAVETNDHGTMAHWEGVRLIDLLREAGVPTGDTLRGKALALYLRIEAADGYRAVYALAELESGFRDGEVILADRRDGKPLDAKEGPFRIVAAGEKRPARWARQVVAIGVLRAPEK